MTGSIFVTGEIRGSDKHDRVWHYPIQNLFEDAVERDATKMQDEEIQTSTVRMLGTRCGRASYVQSSVTSGLRAGLQKGSLGKASNLGRFMPPDGLPQACVPALSIRGHPQHEAVQQTVRSADDRSHHVGGHIDQQRASAASTSSIHGLHAGLEPDGLAWASIQALTTGHVLPQDDLLQSFPLAPISLGSPQQKQNNVKEPFHRAQDGVRYEKGDLLDSGLHTSFAEDRLICASEMGQLLPQSDPRSISPELSLRAELSMEPPAHGADDATPHEKGECKPCFFWYYAKCTKGSNCPYCHIKHDKSEYQALRRGRAGRRRGRDGRKEQELMGRDS